MTIIDADASPEKGLFLEMFIRDLSLEDCILDLVDNAIDSLVKSRGINVSEALLPVAAANNGEKADSLGEPAHISIEYTPKHFKLIDTCGGISVSDARDEVFRFGHTAGAPLGQLGVYGIGLKRAIFKIGDDITIESKTIQDGFRMHVEVSKWAKDRFNWKLPLELIDKAVAEDRTGTSIVIKSLREEVSERFKSGAFEKQLYDRIAHTYCLFIDRYVKVSLNGHKVDPIPLPLGLSEHANVAKEEFKQGDVCVTLYASLASRDSDGKWRAADAGWYAACNGRFVVVADKTDLTGWGAGQPTFVPKYRGFVGIAFFYSQNPLSLPWTTFKRGLNQESLILQRARTRMALIAKPILRFLDGMYASEEIEREPQRRIAEEIKPVDVRKLAQSPSEGFAHKPISPSEASVKVQYDAKQGELERVRKCLRKSGWSAARIGRFTFEHYLKTECPE